MEDTWYFWYDCTEDLAVCKNLSDFESLCSSDERPEFVITNSGDINYVANSGGFGIAGFFNFESDNDVVLGIAVIGLLVIVGMIVQKSFKLAEKNPILVKYLIDGCVECRTGKKPSRSSEDGMELKDVEST